MLDHISAWLHHMKLRSQFASSKRSKACMAGLYDGHTCWELERTQDFSNREWKVDTRRHRGLERVPETLKSSEIDAIFDQTEFGYK